jgi:xanthine dehydrogenase accessory factor
LSNQLGDLLSHWYRNKDQCDWALGTVVKTAGSAYRKAGAMMLFNSQQAAFGLLSGGCLESDLLKRALTVMHNSEPQTVVYDANDENNLSYRLGIGCGGKVHILLQPINPSNDLGLKGVAQALKQRQSGFYHQSLNDLNSFFIAADTAGKTQSWIDKNYLITPIKPPPHLLILGGGADAQPLVNIGKELGWYISVNDPRETHARPEHFPKADRLLSHSSKALNDYINRESVDAVVLMHHSIDLDAEGLRALMQTSIRYAALLGPIHRYQEVLACSGLDADQLPYPISAPAGFDIGGQLPESIALSILAECHAALHK